MLAINILLANLLKVSQLYYLTTAAIKTRGKRSGKNVIYINIIN